MSGYSDSQRGARTPAASASSPRPYATTQCEGEYRPYQQESPPELPQRQVPVTQQQAQQQPPSPRTSMFDFVSPFDALSGTSTGSVKQKPVPAQPSVSSGTEESSSWTNLSSDPKRQTVNNLLEHLTRGYPAQIPAAATYDSYLGGTDFSQNKPSPRKSMFDFVSPFDTTSTGSVKKKPVPAQPSVSSGTEESSSWTNLSSDPKWQTVDNLLEHLTRGYPAQIPAAATAV
ncbi:hypothetical protein C8J57DRAFT_1565230 [Mycena rebaudengoi]|nr:hypothetical protein C8J57DRAFT_1565230 [Mycena rebaudengoi]